MLKHTLVGLALGLATLLLSPAQAQPPGVMAVTNAKIVTVDGQDRIFHRGTILVRNGRIAAVGAVGDVQIPPEAEVIDATGHWVVPGLVDCHNHTAGSLRDLNDGVYLTNPGLRTTDVLSPDNENIKDARAGGVTTVLLIPGSGNNMSGFGTVCRTAGRTVEEMTIRAPGSLKIAQAGNPERYWFGVGRAYMNYNLRQTLQKAKDYHDGWTAWEAKRDAEGEAAAGPAPERSVIWEGFRALFRGDFPVSVHTQAYQVVHSTLRMLHDEFGLNVMLDHSTFDGFKITPMVTERDVFTIVGPRQFYFDRAERRLVGIAERYYAGGVRKLGINTDAPVVPQEELTLQAAIGCRLGLDPYVALKGLTLVPAQSLQVDHLVGSLEVGKEANFGIWTGDPIDPRHACKQTVILGQVVYDAAKERRF